MITSPLKPKRKLKTKSKRLVLAIDFDQTIHDKLHPVEGRKMGPPIDGAYTALHKLKSQGHTIIIHTTMANTLSGKNVIEAWLDFYNIPYDEIVRKPAANFYIDDKALQFTGDWDDILNDIERN